MERHGSGGEIGGKDGNGERHKRFLVDADGPTAVEYAVMLGLILLTAITASSSFRRIGRRNVGRN